MSKGFTLTELLVSLAIIALLAAVVLPVLVNSKQEAYKATCQANLKAIGQTVRMYVDDHDGVWPDSGIWSSWNRSEGVYPKSPRPPSWARLAGCPMVNVPPERVFEINARGYIVGYAYNSMFNIWNTMVADTPDAEWLPTTDKDVVHPATTVVFYDAALDTRVGSSPDPNEFTNPYPYSNERAWERHNGGGNYLFCDNHVKWLRKEQVLPSNPAINDGTKPAFALSSRKGPKKP